MGRLSTYAKNQILKLRFQKHFKITQIVKTLSKEDKIKISRQSVSTFLKKYLETESIHDKPRSGRKRKLTREEIELIGELTRTNRDITARAIKEYLNLNVSTYTILRATKLFEWNKFNPNSNAAKKQAAIARKKTTTSKGGKGDDGITDYESEMETDDEDEDESDDNDERELVKINHLTADSGRMDIDLSREAIIHEEGDEYDEDDDDDDEIELPPCIQLISLSEQTTNKQAKQEETTQNDVKVTHNGVILKKHQLNDELFNLNLLNEKEIVFIKNNACSPMSFATKILFKIYSLSELHGHNVSGKTFHRHILNKKPLEEKRLMYIRYLVEKHFKSEYDGDECKFDALWKSCCNAINKMIRRSELQHEAALKSSSSLQVTSSRTTQSNYTADSSFNEDDAIIINDHIELTSNNEYNNNDHHGASYDTVHVNSRAAISDHTYQQMDTYNQQREYERSCDEEVEMHRPSKFVIVAAVHQPSTNSQKKLIRISSSQMPPSITSNVRITPKIQLKSIKL